MKTISIVILGISFMSCRTTDNKISRMDKHKRFVEVQSNADTKTALLNPAESSKYQEATNETKQKALKGKDKKSLLNLSKLYLMQRKYANAEDTARKVLRIDIKNIEAKKVLAQVALRRNNPEMASILLSSIDAEKSKDSQLINLLGMVALKENKRGLAMEYFRKAVRLNPSDVAVRMNMGVLLVEYRQMNEAAVQFERVLRLMPSHADAKLHLAIIKSTKGKNEEALAVYEEILDGQKNNPLALYNSAVIQRKSGEFEDSLDNLKVYLKTKHAKVTDNTEVFALIERVQNEKSQIDGNETSDSEIQALAAKLKDSSDEPQPKVATVGPGTEEAKAMDESEGSSTQEILDLERQLVE